MSKTSRFKSAEAIAIYISIIALLGSWRSCQTADRANGLANAQSRPYLQVTPTKVEATYVTAREISSNAVEFSLTFEVENVGATPAHDIHIQPTSEVVFHGAQPGGSFSKPIGPVNRITLMPGEKWGFRHGQRFDSISGPAGPADFVSMFTNGSVTCDVDLQIAYRERLGADVIHTRRGRYQFRENEVYVAGSADE